MGLALRESNFRAKAKSRYGYKGMMQCGDSFAKRYGYKPSDLYKANVSIEIAAKYLKAMKKRLKSDLLLCLWKRCSSQGRSFPGTRQICNEGKR